MSSWNRWTLAVVVTLAAGIVCPISTMAQSEWQPGHGGIGFGRPHTAESVQMISSPQLALRGGDHPAQQQEMALRFAIDNGMHINSHMPHSHFLIPTTLTLDAPTGVQIATVKYPQGVDYHLAFDPKEALSVYTGEFGLLVRLQARPGHYIVHGQLHYQACDNRACNPPKTLPLTLELTAK